MVKKNPKSWETVLSEALWVYQTSKRSSIRVTPFILTYGHDVILPWRLLFGILKGHYKIT